MIVIATFVFFLGGGGWGGGDNLYSFVWFFRVFDNITLIWIQLFFCLWSFDLKSSKESFQNAITQYRYTSFHLWSSHQRNLLELIAKINIRGFETVAIRVRLLKFPPRFSDSISWTVQAGEMAMLHCACVFVCILIFDSVLQQLSKKMRKYSGIYFSNGCHLIVD